MNGSTSVAKLLSRAFAILIVLILLAGGVGIAASALQYQSVERLATRVVPMRLANVTLRVVLTDAQRSLRGYLLVGDAQMRASFDANHAAYPAALAHLEQLARGPVERREVQNQAALADTWWAQVLPQRELIPGSAAARDASARSAALFEPIVAENQLLQNQLDSQISRLRQHSEAIRWVTLVTSVTATLVAVLVAALTSVRVTGRINRPLRALVAVLGRLGRGDYSARASAAGGLAEIDAVAGAVNELADLGDRSRADAAEYSRLDEASREVGLLIRQDLSVDAAMAHAATGIGEMLPADHVGVRLADGQHRTWSRPGTPAEAGAAMTAFGLLASDWHRGAGGRTCYVWRPTNPDQVPLPTAHQQQLEEAGATAALLVAFGEADEFAGEVTIVRCDDGPGFSEVEIRAAEAIVGVLHRGLAQAQLYEQERQLVSKLQELDKAKTDFLSTVSHELRTPLTSIAGYVEMLRDGDAGAVTDPQGRMLTIIERNTLRLRELIEDLLVLSRIESGALRLNLEEVDFGPLVTAAVAAVTPSAQAKQIVLDLKVGEGLRAVVDPGQINRVLANLLTNAVKFTPAGGSVRVSAQPTDDGVVVEVADTGIGIPVDELPALFTRFFRASNAVYQAIPGTGLGLPIANTIVLEHGGKIDVTSATGEGTTVLLRLPHHTAVSRTPHPYRPHQVSTAGGRS